MTIKAIKHGFVVACFLTAGVLFAGSLDTLSNQNAGYFFSTAQTASTYGAGIIPYNPAGTALLDKGFYLDGSSQTILKFYDESEKAKLDDSWSQTEPTLSLPSLALAYNFGEVGPGKLAVYANAGIPAGGGSLAWEDGTIGTNAYASTIAALVPMSTVPVAGSETSLDASSVYYGLGGGLSYAFLNDLLSASAGVRYVKATRSGSIDATYKYLTLSAISWNLDVSYDYTYEASGFTPIFGLDIRPADGLTLGFRYEMETDLEFKYDTDSISAKASNTSFNAVAAGVQTTLDSDGKKANQNLPQVASFAAEYVFNPKFTLSAGTNLYFLGAAKLEDTAGNDLSKFFGTGYEINLAGQYRVIEKLLLGATFMYSNQGVKDSYFESSDNLLSASANPPLNSMTFGGGAKYNLFKTFDVLVSGAYIYYIPVDATTASGLKVTYEKKLVDLCIGLSYKF